MVADVVLILDKSRSDVDFCDAMFTVSRLVVAGLPVDQSSTRIGIVSYSVESLLKGHLNSVNLHSNH